jgi:hypothetical protein
VEVEVGVWVFKRVIIVTGTGSHQRTQRSQVHDRGPFAKECGLGERSYFEVGVGGSGDGEAGRASSH